MIRDLFALVTVGLFPEALWAVNVNYMVLGQLINQKGHL